LFQLSNLVHPCQALKSTNEIHIYSAVDCKEFNLGPQVNSQKNAPAHAGRTQPDSGPALGSSPGTAGMTKKSDPTLVVLREHIPIHLYTFVTESTGNDELKTVFIGQHGSELRESTG
jgi:hypothetical protein